MVLSGWLAGHLLALARTDHTIFSRTNRIFWAVSTLFLASLFITLSFTDIFITALIGENQRRNGFLAYFSLLIILIFVYFKMDLIFIERLVKTFLMLGLILGVYGIFQSLGKDFVRWLNPYNPLITTFGNPNFASAFFAVLLCVSLFSIGFKTFPNKYKIISVTVLVLAVICIVRSQSKQGIVAAAFGITFYICCYFWFIKRRFKFITVGSSLSLLLISTLGMLNQGPLASFLYKDSVSVRGFYWRAGIEMFKSSPVVGVGLDRYGSYFKEYRESNYPLRYGFELTSTNAHNTAIQHFSTGGLLLGLSYIILLGYIFIVGLNSIRNSSGEVQRVSLSLLATWITFQAQSFISIDNLGLSIWGWILGGTILSISRQIKSTGDIQLDLSKAFRTKSPNRITLLQPISSTIFLVPILFVSVQLFRFESDSFAIRSLDVAKPSNYKQQILIKNDNLENNFFADPFYVYQSAIALYDTGERGKAISQIKNLLKKDPRNLDYLSWLSWQAESDLDHAQAIKYRLVIALHDPWNATNYLQLGKNYRETGEIIKMERMLAKIKSFASANEIYKSALDELKSPS